MAPKDARARIPGAVRVFVTLHGEGSFADVAKATDLEME